MPQPQTLTPGPSVVGNGSPGTSQAGDWHDVSGHHRYYGSSATNGGERIIGSRHGAPACRQSRRLLTSELRCLGLLLLIGNDEKSLSGTRLELPSGRSEQARNSCVVTDPTGTPLNIRTSPNGKIVGKIANGERIRMSDQTTESGKEWAYISNAASRPLGWVFRKFLAC